MQELYNSQPQAGMEDTQAKQEESILLTLPSQLLYGFLEGMTTLPVARWAQDEPDSTTEQIANSLGHLMGFVGINPIGLGGKLASKLFVKGTMGKYLSALSKHTRVPSLPMYLGNKIASKIDSAGLTPAMEAISFFKQNPIAQDMVRSGMTLGLQSAVGGAPIYDLSMGALEERLHSGLMGTLFGAGNSFLGNTFTRGGKYDFNHVSQDDIALLLKGGERQKAQEAIAASDFRNGLVRAAVSGVVFSTPSMLQGAPLPMVVYDAALNAFFGYKESPIWMKTARSISESFIEAPDLLLSPETSIRKYRKGLWETLDPRTKDALNEMADLQLGGSITNLAGEEISEISSLMSDEVLKAFESVKVVPNNVTPKEGEMNEFDYNQMKKRYAFTSRKQFIEDIKLQGAKQGMSEDSLERLLRDSLVQRAEDNLGVDTRLGTFNLLDKISKADVFFKETLSMKSNFEIDRAFVENGISQYFAKSFNSLVDKTFTPGTKTQDLYTERYIDLIKLTKKYTEDKTLSYNAYAKEIKEKYEIEPGDDVRFAYNMANQSVPRLEITLADDGVRLVKPTNERDQIKPIKYEPSSLMQTMLDGQAFELTSVDDFLDIYRNFDLVKEKAKATGLKDTDESGFAHIMMKLNDAQMQDEKGNTHNLVFYSGNKDQAKLIVGKPLIAKDDIPVIMGRIGNLKVWNKGELTTYGKLFEEGRKRFTDLTDSPEMKAKLSDIYDLTYANNIAFIEKFHNRTINDIVKGSAPGKVKIITNDMQKRWMLEPFSLMKRMQGVNSHHLKVNPLDFVEALNQKPEDLIEVPTLKRVISGGQTGIDRLGLEVAKELGFETGGTAPKGYRTESGDDATLKSFGIKEHTSRDWLPRTEQNVVESDGTIYFATKEDSAGLAATRRYAIQHNKPFILNPTAEQAVKWMKEKKIKTLNVAGNRKSKLSDETLQNAKDVLKTVLGAQREKTTPSVAKDTPEYEKSREEALKALGSERYIILNAVNKADDNAVHRQGDEFEEWIKDYKFKGKNKAGELVDVPFDAHLDGGELVRADIFEAKLKSLGVPLSEGGNSIGAYKGISIHQGNEQGSGIFAKKAIFKAPAKMTQWMKDNNIHSIEYSTTMKIAGERTGSDYYVNKDGSLDVVGGLNVYERPWESSTYLSSDQTYKVNHKQRILKQMLQNIGTDTPEGRAALSDMTEMMKEKINGRKKFENIGIKPDGTYIQEEIYAKNIKEFIESGKNEEFVYKALLNDEIGLVDKVSIFLSNKKSKVWKTITDEIFDREPDNEFVENDEAEFQYFKEYGIVNRVFDSMEEITPSLLASVNSTRNYTQTALKRYIMNELIKPKVKEAMTSTLTPQFSYVDKHIGRGEFYLGNAARKQIVDAETNLTLEQAFKKNKNLEYLIIRAPADSPSGTRVLKFKGFMDVDGNGIFTHPDEYYNLGGADNDIDKVSIYFKMPKSLHDYYKTKAKQWYNPDGTTVPAKENKEYLKEGYRTIPFDPLTNAVVSQNAFNGIDMLGTGLNFTNRLLIIHDWATKEKGGLIDVIMTDNEGNEIEASLKLKSKDVLYKHQRDIVNFAADASNGEPIKPATEIMDIIKKDILEGVPPNIVKVEYNLPNRMYEWLSMLDSIYADKNKFEKITLPTGREVPARYTVQQMFGIMKEYHDTVTSGAFGANHPSGFMYETYRMVGERADEILKTNEDMGEDTRDKTHINWVGNAHNLRVLVSQLGNYFAKSVSKDVLKFHFGRENFGLAFYDSEYVKRAAKGYVREMDKRQAIQDMKAMQRAEEGKRPVKDNSLRPNFEDIERKSISNALESDLRANDIIDLSSIINVLLKGEPAIQKHGIKKVEEIRDEVFKLRKEWNDVKVLKAEGDKNAENDWVIKVTDYFSKIESPELQAYAEAQMISSVSASKKTMRQWLYPKFYGKTGVLGILEKNAVDIGFLLGKDGRPDSQQAYYALSKQYSMNNIDKIAATSGNPKEVAKALYDFVLHGRSYMESDFKDAIARLPFISNKTLTDVFRTYETIIDYGQSDDVLLTLEDTKKMIQENITGDSPLDFVAKMPNYLSKGWSATPTAQQTQEVAETMSQFKDVLKRYPGIVSTLEDRFISFQNESGTGQLPVTFDRMTLPLARKFVDYLDKMVKPSYEITTSSWYKSPQTIGTETNFFDRKTQQVLMRVRDASGIRLVKIDMPSSRVNSSIVVADVINEARGASTKEIESIVFSSDNSEITFRVPKEIDGVPVMDPVTKQQVWEKPKTIIHPVFIKSQLPYEDFRILQEYAIANHEAKILSAALHRNAYIDYVEKNLAKSTLEYEKLIGKKYAITFKNTTKVLHPIEIVTEFQDFIKQMNRKGLSMLNDRYSYRRILSTREEDEKFGYGIKDSTEEGLIRITDLIEKMQSDMMSGNHKPYTDLGINVHNLINWNSEVYHHLFGKEKRTIEQILGERGIYAGSKENNQFFWREYAKEFKKLKAMTDDDGNPLHPILHRKPKEAFDIPKWFENSYFPHLGHTFTDVEDRMKQVLETAAPDSEEYRKAQLWLIKKGGGEMDDIEESLKDSLFDNTPAKDHLKISASVSNHLKSRNGEFFIPGYKRELNVYGDYLKSIAKQKYDTMLVSIHKHNMSRMLTESRLKRNRLDYKEAIKLKQFMDIRMIDVLGYPSEYPQKYVDNLKLDGTFYYMLTNDYWIKKKSPFIDKIFGIKEGTPEQLRSARINKAIHTLSNLEATWAMMPLLASPKFMVTNRFSGGMTTITNAGMSYFVNAHRMSEVKKYVNVNTYSDMVDFVSKHGGIESFIKNELVLSQNVKLGDITEFVKDVINFYKDGKDVPVKRMYELAKQRGLTQEFVDKAAYFMRASEIKNRVYSWFAHYMKAHDTLYKGPLQNDYSLAEDPWLISMANKGVAATQYLYDSLNRPAFARTALGKMLTRFQLFTYNNIKWRKQLLDNAKYEDWNSADGKRLANLVTMDMMVLTLATFFPGTMFSASLNQPYGWVKDLTQWLFGDEKEREKAFFGSMPYPLNIVQPVLPPFTRFLINPIVGLYDIEKFSNTLVWSMFPFGRMINETRKSIDNPLLMPEKSFGIPFFSLIRRIQADYKRREKKEEQEA